MHRLFCDCNEFFYPDKFYDKNKKENPALEK